MASDKEIAQSTAGFVAHELSNETGEKWVAEDRHPASVGYHMRKVDSEARIFVRISADRVVFVSDYPAFQGWPALETVQATASRDASPRTMARAIMRRMLPTMLPEVERARERNQRDQDHYAAREKVSERLADLMVTVGFVPRVGSDRPRDSNREISWYRSNAAHGSIKSDSAGERFKMDLDELTLEQVERVIAALAD